MMTAMRTTVTLDPDTEQIIRRRMRERGMSFKEAINDAIRSGVRDVEREPFRTEAASMGEPTVDLDRALQLAGALEDEELTRRMHGGS
jgi:hypothetical protein